MEPLVNECKSFDEMVNKLESEKNAAVNGQVDETKKTAELEKVVIHNMNTLCTNLLTQLLISRGLPLMRDYLSM